MPFRGVDRVAFFRNLIATKLKFTFPNPLHSVTKYNLMPFSRPYAEPSHDLVR